MTHKKIGLLTVLFAFALCLSACGVFPGSGSRSFQEKEAEEINTSGFLKLVDDEPDTVDPQCTSSYYTAALNVLDRLVEIQVNPDGTSEIKPSLARSWEISEDGLVYTFHLHENVKFSNGSPLTASDVLFTIKRLLTNPDSYNQDLALGVLGAEKLMLGQTDDLEGFQILSDYDFVITLENPYASYLACISTPGASVLDEESTIAAGDRFGKEPSSFVGTGPFILREWNPGRGLVFVANPSCWSGAPRCEGLDVIFASDTETQRLMFENGELDILDLDNLGNDAEYFIHGDIYQKLLHQGPRVGISYVAFNELVRPLNDVRVRKALQLALDRQTLLDAVYSGRGLVEDGIFPHGLIGHNHDLEKIPYDPDAARKLLEEAGYQNGFELEIDFSTSSSRNTMDLLELIAMMWEKIGVRVKLVPMSESDFMMLRRGGSLTCYTSTWSADYNDPDNFIYTFFGNARNTNYRSLCYSDREVMKRVQNAREIVDEEMRIREYQELEKIIAQEDAAWVPLFSRMHYFVVSERVQGFQVLWNGWSSNIYRNVEIIAE